MQQHLVDKLAERKREEKRFEYNCENFPIWYVEDYHKKLKEKEEEIEKQKIGFTVYAYNLASNAIYSVSEGGEATN